MATKRRKKKKNQLLNRILLISLVAHAIALPIAAHFGAFKNVQRDFGTSRVVMFNSPPLEAKSEPKVKPKRKAKPLPAKPSGAKQGVRNRGTNFAQPKVVTGAPGGSGAGGPAAQSGTGAAGQLPKVTGQPNNLPPPTVEKPKEAPKQPDRPVSSQSPKPEPPKAAVKPVPTKQPVITEVVTIEAPAPEIPDDLRAEPLDKVLVIEAVVDTGGHPNHIKIAASSGIDELDQIGLKTAALYRFRSASIDGVKVEQHVRFRIHFRVK